jgi:hypothetical protein
MIYKYGIFQASSKSCVFYKEDKDGNQSTFNIFVKPKEHKADIQKVIAFIDNEHLKQKNWTKSEITDVKDVIDAFGGWASDAPLVFELEAHKSLSHCLSSVLKKDE